MKSVVESPSSVPLFGSVYQGLLPFNAVSFCVCNIVTIIVFIMMCY